MTAEVLAGFAGSLLSLAFSYIPGLSDRFKLLPDEYKRLIMLGLIVVVGFAAYGLSCTEYFSWVACDEKGLVELLKVLFVAATSNYVTFKFSPGSNSRTG